MTIKYPDEEAVALALESLLGAVMPTPSITSRRGRHEIARAVLALFPSREAIRDEALERWKPIDGFPGYHVSDQGRITGKSGRILRQQTTWKGYLRVCLHSNGRKAYATVHSLVLSAFSGPRQTGMHGCHIDGNKLNNQLSNLKWASPSENYDDKRRHGTAQEGEAHGRSKLTAAQVSEIRTAYLARSKQQYGAADFAKRFCVNRTTIERAANGRLWAAPIRALRTKGGEHG